MYRGQSIKPKNGNLFLGEAGAVLDGTNAELYAFRSPANNVTITNLEIVNYGPIKRPKSTGSYNGAITSVGGRNDGGKKESTNWTVKKCNVHHNRLCGIFLSDGGKIIDNYVHHNAQMGVKLYWAESGLVQGNEIAFNNNVDGINATKGYYDRYWEAGGTKFAWTKNLIVRGNHVHDNDGPGLWTDIDNVNTLYEDNVVLDNSGIGIFHEISYSAVIRNNTVRRNGYINRGWLWEAGILIAASSEVEVYGNLVEDNFHGIVGLQQNRGGGAFGPRIVDKINIHDNTVIMTGEQRSGFVTDVENSDFFSRDITCKNNSYPNQTSSDQGFAWDGNNDLTYSQWLEIHPEDKKE